jgi:orotidine-5'-phosphate decarboxylase
MSNPAGVVVLAGLKSRIIVAADYSKLDPAVELARKVGPEVFGIKVGSELAEAVGAPQAVGAIVKAGSGVFRDLKAYDIRNTDVATVAAAVRPGVVMVNMHALNGKAKMAAAHEAIEESATKQGIPTPLLLAVTILTDNDWDDLVELGFFADAQEFPSNISEGQIKDAKIKMVRELVVHLAKLAQEAGLEGVIASAQEAPLIRAACGKKFVIATPGIRPADAPPDDQKRTVTPAEAIELGADLLVIGRPITKAEDPLAVVQRFNDDIAAVLSSRTQKIFKRPSQHIAIPVRRSSEEYLEVLRGCNGYYSTPIKDGQPLGPLVGYSGKYTEGDRQLQYVGFRYFNLAKLEQYPNAAELFAKGLAAVVLEELEHPDCVVGVPEGGKIIGHNTARYLDSLYVGLEKKTVTLATETSKEQTKLTLGRHDVEPGMRVVLCEDLVNNFSTTDKAIQAVEAAGAQVVGIICGMNRSNRVDYNGLPVVSLVHLPTPQYMQSDHEVAAFIENPGVVWDVKPEWSRLEQIMADALGQGVPIL